tara:strand:- start:3912 stop:4397 length:486 start_codon:yes stop_codon:yes gene_type:complete
MRTYLILIISSLLVSCGTLGGLTPNMFNKTQKATDQSTSQLQADVQANFTNGDSKSEKYRNSNITKEETNSTKKSSFWTGIGSFFHIGTDQSDKSIHNSRNKDNYNADSVYQYGQKVSGMIIDFADKNLTAILMVLSFWLGGKSVKRRINKNKIEKSSIKI